MEEHLNYEDRIKRYSLSDLYEASRIIDKEKHPDRYQLLLKEIDERTQGGEIIPKINHHAFFASSVPWNVGVRVWWHFAWRMALIQLFLILPVNLVALSIGHKLNSNMKMINLLIFVFGIMLSCLFGIFVMKHTLAKEYSDFTIVIKKRSDDS